MPATAGNRIRSTLIVGGGLAGIAAAVVLARQGIQVTLLESRQRLGGRTGSFAIRDAAGAELDSVDYCQHVGMSCCRNLVQLIDWLGQRGDWVEHRQLHFFGPDGRYQKLGAWPILPAPLHLSGWLLKWPHLRARDRLSVAHGLLAIRKLSDHSAIQSRLALEWLQAIGQTPRAIESFWSTIIVSALGEQLSRVSLAAVAKVLQDGFLNHRNAFHLLVPQRPLGELFGSRAACHLVQSGVTLQLATPALTFAQLPAQRVQIETRSLRLEADSAILAVPWHQLGKIQFLNDRIGLETIARDALQLHSSPITGVHTWWDRNWLHLPHAAIVGRRCQWVFPKASPHTASAAVEGPGHGRSAEGPYYFQIVVSASRGLRDSEQASWAGLIQEDLAKVFPAVRGARLLACKAVTDPRAVFSIGPQSYHYRPTGALSQRVCLAGDWTQTGWPATMEGAVLSGFAAAEHLLQGAHP